MPLSTEIQFYVEQELLSMESALSLTNDQIQILSKNFVKRIIAANMIKIEYFLTDMDPEGKQQISQVASCLESYVNNNLISTEELGNLDIEQCIKLGQIFVHDLLLSHQLTIEQALGLDQAYAMTLDEVHGLVTSGKLTQEQVLTFTNQQVINLDKIRELILHDVISVDIALGLTEEQANCLRVIHYLAQLAETNMSIGTNLFDAAHGSWHDYFDEVNALEAINRVRTVITNNGLNEVFALFSPNNLNARSPRGLSCNLFFNNILTLQTLSGLTFEQETKLNCDGVYDLLLHRHLTIEQVFALTQGQCYQLDDPTIRAQIIARELDPADIPEPELAVLAQGVINELNNVNRQQSTHTASVHQTVSESAIRLFNRYGAQLDSTNLDLLIETIKNWVHELPNDSQINEAEKRCISRISQQSYTHIDPVSNVSTRQLIALSWLAIHDDSQRIGTLEDAEKQFCAGLYEIQREYNLSETGVDLGGEDLSACFGGTFNKLMEKLVNIHPDVDIKFITLETAVCKMKIVIKEEVEQYLRKRANTLTLNSFLTFTSQLKQLEQDDIEIIWGDIQCNVATRIFEEFNSLFDSKERAKFTNFINAGQYLEISNLHSFHEILMQSNGYQQYCSSIIRSSGIFSGLMRQNSVPDIAQEDGKKMVRRW